MRFGDSWAGKVKSRSQRAVLANWCAKGCRKLDMASTIPMSAGVGISASCDLRYSEVRLTAQTRYAKRVRGGILGETSPHDAGCSGSRRESEPMSIGSRSRFQAWVVRYGSSRLARDLGTNRRTIHTWTALEGRSRILAPSPSYMSRIIALSEQTPFDLGPLMYEDMLIGTTGLRGGCPEGSGLA